MHPIPMTLRHEPKYTELKMKVRHNLFHITLKPFFKPIAAVCIHTLLKEVYLLVQGGDDKVNTNKVQYYGYTTLWAES